jgi:Flp pilus assembly pilin Flp
MDTDRARAGRRSPPQDQMEVDEMYEHVSVFAGRLLTFRLGDLKREDGQGVTEYGLAVAFVAVALGAILLVLSGAISSFISSVGDDLASLPAAL